MKLSRRRCEGNPEMVRTERITEHGLQIRASLRELGEAKFWLAGSANMARVASVRTGKICHFRTLFLWFVSFGGAKEMNKFSKLSPRQSHLLNMSNKAVILCISLR